MTSCQNASSVEVGQSHRNAILATERLSRCPEISLIYEGDEDVDFNPFLNKTPSQEASSSLSYEIEGLDADVVESRGKGFMSVGCNLSLNISSEEKNCAIGGSQRGEEETVMQGVVSPGEACEKDFGEIGPVKPKTISLVFTPQPETVAVCERDTALSSQADVIQDGLNKHGESINTTDCLKSIMGLDDADAICMRTRARYSLASFTLDELETFLQETDDDDDFQNVDDQEEYRKFLAAVLQGGDVDSQTIECENVEEDEDNDADFQIEIEEALESDLDENTRSGICKAYEAAGRRPETRQNRHQKAAQKQKKVLEQGKRPLRPLLPLMRNAPIASFPALEGNHLMSEPAPHCQSSTACDGFPNGFTPHQIGQLHCLIHEHFQLLIQVFSLCVLEPSRQHITSQIQELISEMLHKRDQVLAWKSLSYPSFCFRPPYVHPSVPVEIPQICPAQFTPKSPPTSFAQSGCSSVNNEMPLSANVSPSKIIHEHNYNGQVSSSQTTDGTFWVPYIGDPILSVLDVAPLSLVGRYMDDVSAAKQEHRRRHLEGTSDIRFEREPLFPLRNLPSLSKVHTGRVRVPISPATNTGPLSSPSCQPPKKTMAAALVESTKKQSVALVPKDIVKLVQRFLPLFNPALYPYNPPPVAVAKRVLFTDSEDELLALGLMEYNTDWKAIQHRFLPCKSKHQIFVRQKNRCSSKAPENPIKAVRRLKTSPLTVEEIARINEGLRVFRLDWMSIWKFIVPYRDPSLLPRQWRIALGTQKSYKSDSAKKEKRRLYESNRRFKAAALPGCQTASGKEDNQIENGGGEFNSGDDCVDNRDEAYVHEAFLADWRPSVTSLVSSESPFSNHRKRSQPPNVLLSQEHTHLREETNTNSSGESQTPNSQMHEFLAADSHTKQTFSHLSDIRSCASYAMVPNHQVSKLTLKSSKSRFFSQPYRVRRSKHVQLVKLAPGLPPVNLPPSVRVISQSAFKSYHCGSSTMNAAGGTSGVSATESMVPRLSHGAESGNDHAIDARQGRDAFKYNIANLCPQELGVKAKYAGEGRGTESDLEMHPLLFKAPEDGCLSYYPMNCGTSGASTCFSFSPGNQPQLNLSLFHNSLRENPTVDHLNKPLKPKESTSTSAGIDFHPLLWRTDDVKGFSANGGLASQVSVYMDSLRDERGNIGNPSDIVPVQPQANGGQLAASGQLDLDFHLSSSTSTMEKALINRNVIKHNQNRSSGSAPDSKTRVENQDSSPYCQDGENCSVVSVPNGIGSECIARPCAIPSNSIGEYNDQSLPGIVMEQEELSDSDEEIGEHVEFECEEMADSEGEEGSDCEQMSIIWNKESPNVALDKVVTDADEDPQQGEPIIRRNNINNVRSPLECSTPQLGLTGQVKDTGGVLCLNSKTNSGGGQPIENSKHVESRNEDYPAGKTVASSCSKRSCKKRIPCTQKVTMEKHAVDMSLQPGMVSVAATPLRKPWKRAWVLTVESSSDEK